jgi:hypothetical protein
MTALKREAGVEASSSEEPLRVGSCLSVTNLLINNVT